MERSCCHPLREKVRVFSLLTSRGQHLTSCFLVFVLDGQNPKSPGTGQPNCRCEKCSASTNLGEHKLPPRMPLHLAIFECALNMFRTTGVSSSSHPHYRPNQTQSVYSQSNPIPNSTSHNGQPNSPELFIVQSTKNQTYMATASAHPLQVRMYCGGGK